MTGDFFACFESAPLILTEGAVGQRLVREFGLLPDEHVDYAAMLYTPEGKRALETIYRQYLLIAHDRNLPILLLTNTRRSNAERVRASAFSGHLIMRDYAVFLRGLAKDYGCPAYIGGMMGCKGDAYTGEGALSIEEATTFHTWQVNAFKDAQIDFLLAAIMPAVPEIIGLSRLMGQTGLPYIVSLMITRAGTLPDGHSIHQAIETIDAQTNPTPLCYMTNCVHPAVAREALTHPANDAAIVRNRFRGIQANAAYMTPQELDNRKDLATSGPNELAQAFEDLNRAFPIQIAGGCCGTDNTHIAAIAAKLTRPKSLPKEKVESLPPNAHTYSRTP